MKKPLILFILVFSALFSLFASAQKEDKLVVYCYDSFTGDWGPGSEIVAAFKEKTGLDVELIGCGGAVETYSKVLYEGSSCKADLVIGLSDDFAVDRTLFDDYVPFDYGIFAFVFDCDSGNEKPQSLWDLTDGKYKDKVILVDPRTSSVGLGLLKWTITALGEEKAFEWWKQMKENALTIASSWSTGYGLFTEGEAPLTISYTTSPVYHIIYDNTTRYEALEFSDGHVRTTEYMGLLKTCNKKEDARLFMDFVLNEGQCAIAVANTMFPANENTVLPKAFDYAKRPELLPEDKTFTDKEARYLETWAKTMVE